jgi:hypothetical protein
MSEDRHNEDRPFGMEYLEEMTTMDKGEFGAGGTSVCTTWTTSQYNDGGNDGCSYD